MVGEEMSIATLDAPTAASIVRRHTFCRACGSAHLVDVFDLGQQPLANDFRKPGEPECEQYPLEVLQCQECGLAQLSVVVSSDVLYKNYHYRTSTSDTMRRHFHKLLTDICGITNVGRVVEIGSNDGAMLRQWIGVRHVVGNEQAALQAFDVVSTPDVVIARHVFNHVDNWREFMVALDTLCGEKTVVVIEVPDVRKVVSMCQFDTIYHEHLSYLSAHALLRLLEPTDFRVLDVWEYPIHCGSVAFVIARRAMVGNTGWEEPDGWQHYTWRTMQHSLHAIVGDLKMEIEYAKLKGKRVCAYGASAKSTVLLNSCGFTPRDVQFITDTTPSKQGCLSPGTGIPVVEPEELYSEKADIAIMTAWNYEREILEKERDFTTKGGKFIVPIPTVRVVP
jgi:novobiocin biosynthesis protein NovU/D-mycarose 3-C-methyltransferase